MTLRYPFLWGLGLYLPITFSHTLIPNAKLSPLYYQLGGGQDVRLPPAEDSQNLDLDASIAIHSGAQCGVFNPAISLSSTLNQLHDALKNAEKAVIKNATAAVSEFPMYELARINPTLYNILNNAMLHAHKTIRLATKSCEQVQQEISDGKNPYQAWATLAVGHQWQKQIGLALDDPSGSDEGVQSITLAQSSVLSQAHQDGVPWITKEAALNSTSHLAGGQNQPPIHVVADTVMAGYRVWQSTAENTSSSHLYQLWASPQAAADWAVQVLGDQVISFCDEPDCHQGSTVGEGLLRQLTHCAKQEGVETNSSCVAQWQQQLENLIAEPTPPSEEALAALSTPTLAISPSVVQSLRALSPLAQAFFIQKLAHALVLQHVIDKALLIRRLLITGRQVPAIASNGPAQSLIQQCLTQLEKDIEALLWEKRIRQKSVANPLQKLLHYTQQQQQAHLNDPPTPAALLEGGSFPEKEATHE